MGGRRRRGRAQPRRPVLPGERELLEQARRLLEIVGSSEYEQERHTALRQALRKLRDLERRTGWQLPSPAALALEQKARGVLAA